MKNSKSAQVINLRTNLQRNIYERGCATRIVAISQSAKQSAKQFAKQSAKRDAKWERRRKGKKAREGSDASERKRGERESERKWRS